jgi:hypothetical protein
MMKKWALPVVALYVGFFLLAILPYILTEVYIALASKGQYNRFVLDIWAVQNQIQFWILCVLLLVSQIFLLSCPHGTTNRRTVARPAVHSLTIATVLLSLILLVGMLSWFIHAAWGSLFYWTSCALALVAVNWVVWLWIFARLHAGGTGNSFVRWIENQLSQGNILKFLVKEIQTVFAGQREISWANGIAVIPVAAGVVVMILVYGPGISFLFAADATRRALESADSQTEQTDSSDFIKE